MDSTVRRRSSRDDEVRDRRRRHVANAALQVVDETGADAGTALIAERAGIPRPHVYRYFASREDLDNEVARLAAQDLIQRVRPHLARRGTPGQVVEGLVRACATWADAHPHLYRFLAARGQSRTLHRARMGRSRLLDEIAVAARGYTKSGDELFPEGILVGVMGMVDATVIWWLDQRDETLDVMVRRLSRHVTLVLQDALASHGIHLDPTVELEPFIGE
ncbi:AcrR family transcriptional regulator [Nocardioides marinisabuli]|uniref:AcrR family transcriptional regulator n=1 Tax=Nocardioides marinisabuli TaxID=419476 RepID=A0A7Y9JRW0_9ACTN|nr:TetR/AcrR family transcriptional regulator [Nocardioides marinisabuli]NYD58671.1 AcrR family transcriptional regulator [Nocardioides marinisabuli]